MVCRSICLMIQQSLPVMLFDKEHVTVTYRGGTDTDHAPPIDHYVMVSYYRMVTLMMIRHIHVPGPVDDSLLKVSCMCKDDWTLET